jgi:hypothetical protein
MNNRRGKGRDEILVRSSSSTTLPSLSTSLSSSLLYPLEVSRPAPTTTTTTTTTFTTTTHPRKHKAQQRHPKHQSFWWCGVVVILCAVTTSLGIGWFLWEILPPPPPPPPWPSWTTLSLSTTTTNNNKVATTTTSKTATTFTDTSIQQTGSKARWNVKHNGLEQQSQPPSPLSRSNHHPRTTTTNKTAVEIAMDHGFWQRMQPVPRHRWTVVSNTTCVIVVGGGGRGGGVINSDDNNTVKSQKKKKKKLKNTPTAKHHDTNWHLRVPYVILMGTQKGGTTALAYYLYNHPQIVYLPTKELSFFDEELDQNPNLIVVTNSTTTDTTKSTESSSGAHAGNSDSGGGGGIPQVQALEYYQQQVIGTMVPLVKLQLEQSLKVLDATPNYLFCSDRVIRRILCICPWVKLLVLLRDPVARAYSQYHMQWNRDVLQHAKAEQEGRGLNSTTSTTTMPTTSFEDYVLNDIHALIETGVLLPNAIMTAASPPEETTATTTLFDQHFGSEAEFQAWSTYTKLGLNSPVGRGLYAIQLNHLLQALRGHFGANVTLSNHVWVQSSELFRNQSQREYHSVLEFLQLPRHDLSAYTEIHKTSYTNNEARGKRTTTTTTSASSGSTSSGGSHGMSPEIRNLLQRIFEPYNGKLVELLQEIQGDQEHNIGPVGATTTSTTPTWDTIWSTKRL